MSENILTPVGRMVQGDLFVPQTKDMEGRPLTDKNGAPRVNYFFAIAVPKADPGVNDLIAQIHAVGQAGFPAGQWKMPGFSWKIVDGDDPTNNAKEGFIGHWVFRVSSGFPPPVWETGGTARIVEPGKPKRGDYIRAVISIAANGSTSKPGVYLNHQLVEFVGYGQAISSGPDGAEVFGAAPKAVLPAGASLTPVAGPPIAAPGLPGAAPVAAPVTPAPVAAPVTPAIDFLNPPVPPAAPAAPPAKPVLTAKAGTITYDQMIAAGWTDLTLKQHGYIDDVPWYIDDVPF